MTDIHNRKGWFKGMPRATRDELRDAVLDVIDAHRPTLIFTVVDKQRHVAKYGMHAMPPEDYTYMLMIERFNHFHWSRMLQIVDVATWLLNRGMRDRAKGLSPPAEMKRLEQHVDGYPDYMGKGVKIVP
jgi:hypothetical protein